jgi:hypothetical protein
MRGLSQIGVVVMAMAAAVAIGATPAASDTVGATFRMLTYNTKALPWLALDNESNFGMSDERRAHEIAKRIKSGDYDVVALNEVFDEDVRDVLVEELRPVYPTIIEKLDVDKDPSIAGDFYEDSGLMLLSKFPVERTPAPPGGECYDYWETLSPGGCTAAFHMYQAGEGEDMLSAKGIGFVRLRHPRTNELINVFFTHLQNGDPVDVSDIRADQIGEAVGFADVWAPPGDAQTFLMGDLNIIGAPNPESTQEYQDQLVTGGFGAAGFADIWRRHTSPEDPGVTHGPANSQNSLNTNPKRVDYILHRGRTRCFLHQTVDRTRFEFSGLVDGHHVGTDLSDHYGVAVVVGDTANMCSPQVTVAGTHPSNGTEVPAKMPYAGGRVWFRFDDAGTYSLALNASTGSGLFMIAYYVDDLSTPIEAPLQVTPGRVTPMIVAPNGPFYVQVSATGTLAGDFGFYVRRHNGASLTDAIVLDPFQQLHQIQMTDDVQAPMAKVYYRFHQRRLSTGGAQSLRFVTRNHSGLPLRIQILDRDGNPLPGLTTAAGQPNRTLTADPATSPISGEEQKLFFTVDRQSCSPGCLGSYDVRWETDYTHLDMRRFRVVEQNDSDPIGDAGEDEPRLYATVDGATKPVIDPRGMDEGQFIYLPDWARHIGFSTSVTVRLREEDDFANGEWDDYGTKTISPPATSPSSQTHVYSDDSGEYLLEVTATRLLDD